MKRSSNVSEKNRKLYKHTICVHNSRLRFIYKAEKVKIFYTICDYLFPRLYFKMGFLAATPFLVKGLCSPMSGLAADVLRKSTVSTKNVRKVFYAAGKPQHVYVILNACQSVRESVSQSVNQSVSQ